MTWRAGWAVLDVEVKALVGGVGVMGAICSSAQGQTVSWAQKVVAGPAARDYHAMACD